MIAKRLVPPSVPPETILDETISVKCCDVRNSLKYLRIARLNPEHVADAIVSQRQRAVLQLDIAADAGDVGRGIEGQNVRRRD